MARLNRLLIYTRKIDEMTRFYGDVFGFTAHRDPDDRIVELRHPDHGFVLMLHPAGKGQRQGQAQVKLIFDVPDVPAFCDQARAAGAKFGAIHSADGYVFANAKDPALNSVQVSSRAFRPG